VNFLRRGSVRGDAARLAGAMRWGYDRATATAAHHRIVINLDEDTFVVERCEGKINMTRSLDEAKAEEQQAIAAQYAMLPEMIEAAQAGQSQASATGPGGFAAPGVQGLELPETVETGDVGASAAALQCAPVKGKDKVGKPQKLAKDIRKVYVSHLVDPVDKGKVSINFFASGRAERAIVEVADGDDNVFSLRLHPLTGRVEIHTGEYRRPEDIVKGEEVRP
jgi:hypothetical protein